MRKKVFLIALGGKNFEGSAMGDLYLIDEYLNLFWVVNPKVFIFREKQIDKVWIQETCGYWYCVQSYLR
jgi:hypothetical protein